MRTVSTAILLSIAMATTAHAYQVETNIKYESGEVKTSDDNMDIDTYGINAKYYFDQVSTQKGPLAEAAFINKVGNIGLAGVSSQYGSAIDSKINAYGLSSEHYVDQLYLSTQLSKTEYKISGHGLGVKLDQLGYGAEIGYLPVNNLLIAVGVAKNDIKPDQQTNFLDNSTAMAMAVANNDTYKTVRAKYLANIGSMYANFEAKAAFAEDEIYTVSSDLYLTPKFSIGTKFTEQTQEGGDHYWTFGVQNYFTENFALKADYTKLADNYDSYAMTATLRF